MSFIYKIFLLYPYWFIKTLIHWIFQFYKNIFCLHIDENKILIPLSKVTFGFGVGGSEFNTNKGQIINNDLIENESYPFGGGTLGGVNIEPIAFLMIDNDNSKIIRIEQGDTLFDKLLELSISLIKKSNKKSTK